MRYRSLNSLATLSYTVDMMNNASIVSSIEFDKDQARVLNLQITKERVFKRDALTFFFLLLRSFSP